MATGNGPADLILNSETVYRTFAEHLQLIKADQHHAGRVHNVSQWTTLADLPVDELRQMLAAEQFVTGGPGTPEPLIQQLTHLAADPEDARTRSLGTGCLDSMRIALAEQDSVFLNWPDAPTLAEGLLLLGDRYNVPEELGRWWPPLFAAHERDIYSEEDGTYSIRLWWD
jgi:hypothetical protein